jgi:hypothetical protein
MFTARISVLGLVAARRRAAASLGGRVRLVYARLGG